MGRKGVTGYGLEKARAGHVTLAWKGAADEVNYTSFFPNSAQVFRRVQELVNSGVPQADATRQAKQETPGVFKSFDKDLDLYSRLPNRIQRNLTWDDNQVLYMHVEVAGWNNTGLTAAFKRFKKSPPVFDLKGRNELHSCSTVVLDLIDSSIKIDKYKHAKECAAVYSDYDLFSNERKMLLAALLPAVLPLSYIGGRVNALTCNINRQLRTGNSINPNFVKSVFTIFTKGYTEWKKWIAESKFEKRY